MTVGIRCIQKPLLIYFRLRVRNTKKDVLFLEISKDLICFSLKINVNFFNLFINLNKRDKNYNLNSAWE